MPSPLGHALAGAAAGLALTGASGRAARSGRSVVWRLGALFALLGTLPDFDLLLPLEHRGASHSLTAALIAGLCIAALTQQGRLGFAAGAAYGSHVLLDWLGTDTSAPVGLMALWPVTREYYESGAHLFHAISRRYWLPDFWSNNLRAVARELLILLPPTLLVLWAQHRHRQSVTGPHQQT